MTLPVPDKKLHSIYSLTPEMLKRRGITLLLLDLDNTLAPYSADAPNAALTGWVEKMRSGGITLFILSNNRGSRPEVFGKALSLPYVSRAKKPDTAMLFKVLEQYATLPEHAAIIGDQIYTDVLCGTRSGVYSIVVTPLSLRNPLHLIRYAAELPLRAARRK